MIRFKNCDPNIIHILGGMQPTNWEASANYEDVQTCGDERIRVTEQLQYATMIYNANFEEKSSLRNDGPFKSIRKTWWSNKSVCLSPYIWRFPEIGVPLVIIHFERWDFPFFSIINQPFWGSPSMENPHMCFHRVPSCSCGFSHENTWKLAGSGPRSELIARPTRPARAHGAESSEIWGTWMCRPGTDYIMDNGIILLG